MGNSTLYTIGTVLNRALDNGLEVDLLVNGHWITGVVAAVDGFGVVLASSGDQHAVVRMEAVAAVKVVADLEQRDEITSGAHAMPGPAHPQAEPHLAET